jgi:ribokinase
MIGSTCVLGPAYLDRVVEVDRPLAPPEIGQVMDASVEGSLVPDGGDDLVVAGPEGVELRINSPCDWPGPRGRVVVSRPLAVNGPSWKRTLNGIGWRDDLGGMGAGYASAFGGTLISALGATDDPVSVAVSRLLDREGIPHSAFHSAVTVADWTLLISSGPHGDKLPIGFRGCHDAVATIPRVGPCRLLVLAGLPNRLLKAAAERIQARVVFLAPAMRNVLDRRTTIESFVDRVHLFSGNRAEWNELADPDRVRERVAVVAITDGPNGCEIAFRDPRGERQSLRFPAFPRSHPPRDTNRAGEAFASTLVRSLLESGWDGGPVEPSHVRRAAERAGAAAALVLDRADFGFPTEDEVDRAVRRGIV